MDKYLKKSDLGIEWGSGRSTLWFANRVSRLISVEDNIVWYKTVSAQLNGAGLANVEYHFLEIKEKASVLEQPYVKTPLSMPDNSLNFALVDGKVRDVCAISVLSKIVSGGLLIIDNIELYIPSDSKSPLSIGLQAKAKSEIWEEFVERVQDWRLIWTTNGVSDTCIWIKPC